MLITVGHGVFSDTSAEDHHAFQFLFESGELFCEFVVRPSGLAQDRLLHQCSLVCAPNVVIRCRVDDPRWPFFESFASVHRGHFYSNPSAGTLLSTDDYCMGGDLAPTLGETKKFFADLNDTFSGKNFNFHAENF